MNGFLRNEKGQFVKGHIRPQEWIDSSREWLRKNRYGINNPRWTNNPSYVTIHHWVESHKPKQNFCEKCNKNKKLELANISGEYKRDIDDFEWLCRKCHMEKDERLSSYKLQPRNKGRWVSKE